MQLSRIFNKNVGKRVGMMMIPMAASWAVNIATHNFMLGVLAFGATFGYMMIARQKGSFKPWNWRSGNYNPGYGRF